MASSVKRPTISGLQRHAAKLSWAAGDTHNAGSAVICDRVEPVASRVMSVIPRRSQPVEATLYLRGKRWSAEWNEDFIEVLLRQRRRSCGIAGSAGSR